MMVPMKVFGLAVDEDTQVPVLILKDLEETKVLPIWIGAMEAMAISMALNDVELPRPMTHDLFVAAVTTLDAKIVGLEVISLKDGTYYAELEVEHGGNRKRIDCRPSDGIALALRAAANILVDDSVLEQAGTDDYGEGKPVIQSEDADQWTEMLEKMNPDDTKYKM